MIRGSYTIKKDPELVEMLDLLRGRRSLATISRFLLRGVAEGSAVLLKLINRERLTGDGPFPVPMKRLGKVSGRLLRDMRFTRPTFTGGLLKTAVGSNVKYFGRHEFGGSGRQVRVRAHQVRAHERNQLFGRSQRVKIPAHTRQAYLRKDTMPKREPVMAGVREHAQRTYGIAIENQLIRALEGRKP